MAKKLPADQKKLPVDVTNLFDSLALSAQPEDIIADAYAKLTPGQKVRFSTIVESLRSEYPDGVDMVQLSMAALAAVIQISAMAHFVDVINEENIKGMSESEVEALEYARKVYNENFNNVIKQIDNNTRQTSFLKELEEFKLKQNPDGSIEFTAKAMPKLKLNVIDVAPKEEKK